MFLVLEGIGSVVGAGGLVAFWFVIIGLLCRVEYMLSGEMDLLYIVRTKGLIKGPAQSRLIQL